MKGEGNKRQIGLPMRIWENPVWSSRGRVRVWGCWVCGCGVWGCVGGVWGWWGVRKILGIFWEISREIPEFSRNFPGNFRGIHGIRITKSDIMERKINIFTFRLKKNNSEIMLNPPVQYLRNSNFCPIWRFFPTPFICIPVQLDWSTISIKLIDTA